MALSKTNEIEKIKTEWKRLWQERLDDKIRAEGIATQDYSSIFVEKGTVIHATKDYKALNLREIIERHDITNPDRYLPLNPTIGGWTKFIKTSNLIKFLPNYRQKKIYSNNNFKNQQPKKGGRGWLHK